MKRSGRSIGDVTEAMLESETFTMEIVDVIEFIHAVDPNKDPFIVGDIDSVLAAVNRLGVFRDSIQYNELWVSTSGEFLKLLEIWRMPQPLKRVESQA